MIYMYDVNKPLKLYHEAKISLLCIEDGLILVLLQLHLTVTISNFFHQHDVLISMSSNA